MTVVLNQAIEADHESDAREAFEVFENLLIVESSLLSKSLAELLHFFVGLCANTKMDAVYREMALSFMATAIGLYYRSGNQLTLENDDEYNP